MEERAEISLPRPLRIAAVALAGWVLFCTFVYLGFPYQRLGPFLAFRIEQATGVVLRIGDVSASPQWLGPGIALTDVRARLPDGREQSVTRLRVRPAWSLSWLLLRPALALDAESPSGSLEGTLTLASPASFAGDLRGVDLAALGLGTLAGGVELDGTADLALALAFDAAGTEGTISLVAREGTIEHPSLPMVIPYQAIQGELALGGETALRIDRLEIDSSLGQGAIGGSVGRATAGGGAPLDLAVELEADPSIVSVLRAQGMRIDARGSAKFRIAGTTLRPIVR